MQQKEITGRFPLHIAANLGYANFGIEEDRTPEQARELSRKFERAFGEAWERLPVDARAKLQAHWEEFGGYYAGVMKITPADAQDLLDGESVIPGAPLIPDVEPTPENLARRVVPMNVPNIELLNDWSGYDRENGVLLARNTWMLGMSGIEIRFWIPAVEAMPERAVVSLILWQLAQICVYADWGRYNPHTSTDLEEKGAFRIALWPRASLFPLRKWLKSEAASEFYKGWNMMLDMESEIDETED
jgi:hypothetical protein